MIIDEYIATHPDRRECLSTVENEGLPTALKCYVTRVIASVHITLSLPCGLNESAIRACGELS